MVATEVPDPKEVARIAKDQEILKADDLRRKKQQASEDAKKAQAEREQQVRCDAARNRFYALKDARRLFDRDAEGNRVYLSDADADARREQARAAMATACGT